VASSFTSNQLRKWPLLLRTAFPSLDSTNGCSRRRGFDRNLSSTNPSLPPCLTFKYQGAAQSLVAIPREGFRPLFSQFQAVLPVFLRPFSHPATSAVSAHPVGDGLDIYGPSPPVRRRIRDVVFSQFFSPFAAR